MQPAKARLAIYSSVGGTLTSFNEVHLRKVSCSIMRSLRGSLGCCRCLQCAKAEPMISVTSVLERSTSCSCRQRSQAAGPIHFGGRDSEVIPASRKQHSGRQRVKLAGLYSDCPKSRCRNAVAKHHRTGNTQTSKQKTQTRKPNPRSKGQVRNSSRLCQPVEKGETWGDEFSLCTQYVTIASFSDLPMRRQYQHSCSS